MEIREFGKGAITMHIEALAIGRELLTGRTLEANANWLAKHVASLGGRLARIAVVDDDAAEIAAAVREAKARGADVLVVTGGLGPTFDDVTLAGVALAAGAPLAIDAAARRWIEEKYHDLFRQGLIEIDGLTPEREKMARLPAGARWFENPVGTAPAAALAWDGLEIWCLPGVPRELRAIFDAALAAPLAARLTGAGFAEATLPTDALDESTLTAVAQRLTEKHPGLHVKTNPTYFGDAEGLRVTFSANADSPAAARALVEAAIGEWKDALAKASKQ